MPMWRRGESGPVIATLFTDPWLALAATAAFLLAIGWQRGMIGGRWRGVAEKALGVTSKDHARALRAAVRLEAEALDAEEFAARLVEETRQGFRSPFFPEPPKPGP